MIFVDSVLVFGYIPQSCVDFVWVFDDFKTIVVNNGGFACSGPGNAGETLICGHDPRNFRVKKTRRAEGC